MTINGSNGNDGFFSSSNGVSLALFTFNGGNSADVLVGTAGNDTLNGDAGNDRLFGEAGDDTLNCGADTDSADGGTGTNSQALCETILNIP